MKCCICNGLILPGECYYYDEYGNVAHTHHEIENCPVCGRLIGNISSGGKVTYSDGRFICCYCRSNENPVTDTVSLKQSFVSAKELLQEKGFNNFPKIAVHFVSKDDFAQLGYHDGTFGLTTSIIGVNTTTHKISVLYGLPMLLTTGVLAHELLHVWQDKHGIIVEPQICEGLCELGSGLVYKRANSVLGKILFNKLEQNMKKVYSEGFVMMKKKLETHGWQAVQEYVKQNSKKNY